MKYVISFTICLFSAALVHGQTVPKKPKKKAKQQTTEVAKPVAKTELDEVTPAGFQTANAKKLETPAPQQTTVTHSKPTSSNSLEIPKTTVQPSVFSAPRTSAPKEDEVSDTRKPVASGVTQPDFEENEVRSAKEKLATDAQLKPESVNLEANPFGRLPGERTVPAPTGQINQPVEVPQLLIKSDPKQDDAPVVTAPQPVPVAVAAPVDNGLTTRGETSVPAQKVEVAVKKEEPAVDKMAIMTFEHKTINLGRMRLGESKNHTFTFTNKGKEAVEIELMDVCPCTQLEWDKNPIPPGATSTIRARFDSQKVFPEGVNHEIEKVITIILKNTDPKNGYPLIEELKLKAFVEYKFQD
jgi:Protein of unknown function (DUF1573)